MRESGDHTDTSSAAVLSLLPVLGKSVVDFGCGQGDWLRRAESLGASDILGLDTYSTERPLGIPACSADLSAPVALSKRYDLAICVEVAEHLPPESSSILAESLANAADLILFSSAVPGQGGCFHLNEQAPSYWSDIFRSLGFLCFDPRPLLWNQPGIEPWYKQNLLLFCRPEQAQSLSPELRALATASPLHLIHPEIFRIYAPRESHVIFRKAPGESSWTTEIIPFRDISCD